MTVHNVLIVEDQRDLARMIRSGFATLGHAFHVLDVPSGEEALLIAARNPVDLLIIDVKLPGISGLDLMEKFRKSRPDLKVILITGVPDKAVRARVAGAGADAYFYKPVELSTILAAAERLLQLEPGPAEPQEQDESPPSLSAYLASLRQELGAIAAMVLDERGKLSVQAGDLPQLGRDAAILPAVMGVYSSSEKLSATLGMTAPDDLLSFSGAEFHLHLTHLGTTHALLVAIPYTPGALRVEETAAPLRRAAQDLRGILANMGVPVVPEEILPAESEAVAGDVPSPGDESIDLEGVLEGASEQQLEPDELDAFWESEQSLDTGSSHPDALSYDQARKLGLTPSED